MPHEQAYTVPGMPERFIRDPSIDTAHDVAPTGFYKSQREIYQSVKDFPRLASTLHYQFTKPDTQPLQIQARHETEITNTEHHTVMSLSDIELATTPLSEVTTKVSEAEVISAVNGIAGHTITVLVTEALRSFRERKPIQLTDHQTGIDPYERKTIDAICSNVLATSPILHPTEVTPFVWHVWQQLKPQYTFFKMIPNSTKKPRIEGTQHTADFVHDYWQSEEMSQFEEELFDLHQTRLNNYVDYGVPLTATDTLSIESNPEYELAIEQLVICHKHFGAYKIQFKGQADFVATQKNRKTGETVLVLIDQKHGKADKLHSLPNRLQALLYSDALKEKQFSKKKFSDMTPRGVMFLYHVFDTEKDDSFYIDASVYPDEYQHLMDELFTTTRQWWMYQKEYKALKFEKQHAAVMPHIPHPKDEVRPIQFSMF